MLPANTRPRQVRPTYTEPLYFTHEQLTRFRQYHALYRTGYYQRDEAAERRLEFARWLNQHGKLSEE